MSETNGSESGSGADDATESGRHDEQPSSTERTATRRRVLAAGAVTAAVGVAGCGGITEQSFEASAVTLPEEDREALGLGETVADSQTLSREGPAGEVEVEITNHFAGYSRGEYLRAQFGEEEEEEE